MITTTNFKLLKAIREECLAQADLVPDVIVSEARVSRIIRKRVKPTADEIERICKKLGRSPAQLGL